MHLNIKYFTIFKKGKEKSILNLIWIGPVSGYTKIIKAWNEPEHIEKFWEFQIFNGSRQKTEFY